MKIADYNLNKQCERFKFEVMEKGKSIDELIRSARSETKTAFKERFRQKWFGDIPAFRWSELHLTRDLKATIYTENPTVWLLRLEEDECLDDKQWDLKDVRSVIAYDYLENGHESTEDDTLFQTWLREDINSGIELLQITNEESIMVYTGGTGPYAKNWLAMFEKQLKQ